MSNDHNSAKYKAASQRHCRNIRQGMAWLVKNSTQGELPALLKELHLSIETPAPAAPAPTGGNSASSAPVSRTTETETQEPEKKLSTYDRQVIAADFEMVNNAFMSAAEFEQKHGISVEALRENLSQLTGGS